MIKITHYLVLKRYQEIKIFTTQLKIKEIYTLHISMQKNINLMMNKHMHSVSPQ